MVKREWAKKTIALAMMAAIISTSIPPVEVYALHGTATEIITKDMVNNKPPKDYVINQDMQAEAKDGVYSKYFLKDSVQTVSITVEENNFNYLLQNAVDEPYVMTQNVMIGDQSIGYAGLKTKGNYTKEATFASASDRFSFTINFGKFIKKKDYGAKQNFYGAAKISFNNLFFDKSAMKEYCAFRLMDEMGLPTPEYGIAKLYINNEYYGVYFMVEAMDKTIMERYLGTDEVSDYVVKPEKTRFIYDEALNKYKDENGNFTMDSLKSVLYKNEDGDYEATGDLLDCQPLWESDSDTLQDVAKMIPTVLSWEEKLNLLSQGKDFDGNKINTNSAKYIALLEQVIDVDEFLRYFATHSFIVQQDNMFSNYQNFAIYVDEAGISKMIPWDYDMGWGCYFDPYDAESVANNDLDNMYSVNFNGYKDMTMEEVYEQFPLFNVIFQSDKLMKKYHSYMEDCAKIAAMGGTTSDGRVFEAGRFTKTIEVLEPQIVEAAAEPMPERVYYLNGYIQPRDMILGMETLKNFIPMRSVGVWSQVNKINSLVTTYGANLYNLGTGMTGKHHVNGTLTTVDGGTGIFAVANYTEEGNVGPKLEVETLSRDSQVFIDVKEKLGCVNDNDVIVYAMSNTKTPSSLYEMYIPVSEEMDTKKTEVYEYDGEMLTKLVSDVDDNLYKVRTDDISYIVVAKNAKPDNRYAVKQSQKEAKDKVKYEENTSYIVGDESMTTAWWWAHSKHYELAQGTTLQVEFENYSEDIDIWDNYVMVFTNEAATYGLEQTPGYYQEYAVVRADDFGWGMMGHTLTYASTHETWEEFREIVKASKVQMTVTRDGSDVIIHEVVTSLVDENMSYERTVTFMAEAEDMYFTLTTEGGYLKVNSVEVQ